MQLIFPRLLDGQVSGFGSPEDLIDVGCHLTRRLKQVGSEADESGRGYVVGVPVGGRQTVSKCEGGYLLPVCPGKAAANDKQSLCPLLLHPPKGSLEAGGRLSR